MPAMPFRYLHIYLTGNSAQKFSQCRCKLQPDQKRLSFLRIFLWLAAMISISCNAFAMPRTVLSIFVPFIRDTLNKFVHDSLCKISPFSEDRCIHQCENICSCFINRDSAWFRIRSRNKLLMDLKLIISILNSGTQAFWLPERVQAFVI